MTQKKALIIGGGIAGPVTAMALQRAGIDPVVYEAYDTSAALDLLVVHDQDNAGGNSSNYKFVKLRQLPGG